MFSVVFLILRAPRLRESEGWRGSADVCVCAWVRPWARWRRATQETMGSCGRNARLFVFESHMSMVASAGCYFFFSLLGGVSYSPLASVVLLYTNQGAVSVALNQSTRRSAEEEEGPCCFLLGPPPPPRPPPAATAAGRAAAAAAASARRPPVGSARAGGRSPQSRRN